jgi:hypothetical protein
MRAVPAMRRRASVVRIFVTIVRDVLAGIAAHLILISSLDWRAPKLLWGGTGTRAYDSGRCQSSPCRRRTSPDQLPHRPGQDGRDRYHLDSSMRRRLYTVGRGKPLDRGAE